MAEFSPQLEESYSFVKLRLLPAGFQVSEYESIDYGIQFSISNAGISGLVRIYFNKKKGIKYDFSQIRNEGLQAKLNVAIAGVGGSSNSAENSKLADDLLPIIGIDESGKGDYFGPLVVAAVYVNTSSKGRLQGIEVRDSKKVSDAKIHEIASKIKSICQNEFVVIEISPETYNRLYGQFKQENKNLNTLLGWGHAKAIEELLGKVECKHALSDKFADEKAISSKLQEKGKTIVLMQEHKAERNIAVAAASILARERFLDKLNKLSKDCGLELSKGASENVIEQAKRIVELHGKEFLTRIAKIHFKTSKSL